MNRKLTGLVAAAVFALVGTLVLVGYVRSAEARAASGEETVDVLVVTSEIPAGTKADELAEYVEVKQVPAKVRAANAIDDLADLEDLEKLVVSVDLLPGEQVVTTRFSTAIAREGVPEGLLEVTVRLQPERALGGNLSEGDRVAVVSSFAPFDLEGMASQPGAPKKTPNETHIILHDVLVTKVQASEGLPSDDDEDKAPDSDLLVTLALDAASVQRVVFTAEYGTLWLSAEPNGAPTVELPIIDRGSVF